MSKVIDSIQGLCDTIIFGGTFDPIQNAHLSIAKIAQNTLNYHCVAFVPSKQNPLKKHPPIASDKDRIIMLELALQDSHDMYIWRYEIASAKAPSFTIDTIKKAREENSDSRLAFLTGSDVIKDLASWKDPEEILTIIDQWIIVQRGDNTETHKQIIKDLFSVKNSARNNLKKFYWITDQINPVSSSDIRANISNEKMMNEYLPSSVLSYIKERDIYR